MALSTNLKTWLCENDYAQSSWTDESLYEAAATKAVNEGALSAKKFHELQGTKAAPADVFGSVRVKKPSERYNATKSVAKHSKSGLPVRDERGREVQTVSELEYAKSGVFLKRMAQKVESPANCPNTSLICSKRFTSMTRSVESSAESTRLVSLAAESKP